MAVGKEAGSREAGEGRNGGLLRAIGLMSGTSLDGVDVAVIETDGEAIVRPGPAGFHPYEPHERALLRKALDEATELAERTERYGVIAEAEELVTHRHMRAIDSFLSACALKDRDIDIIGFHGQTILHRPDERLTVQIGDGAALARHMGIPVVYDFRAADVAAGGQGAPLVPLYHQALVRSAGLDGPVAVLNIGGVANITWVDAADGLHAGFPVACDTGPGNALIDDFMLERTGRPIDRDGEHAAKGQPDAAAVAAFMSDPFFLQSPPKSLDRDHFRRPDLSGLSTEDGAATLVEFTVRAAVQAVEHCPRLPRLWVVSGGGSHNAEIVRRLIELANAPVRVADELGWSADAMEAQAFGYLAVRSRRGLPLSLPTTTGVDAPVTGGVFVNR